MRRVLAWGFMAVLAAAPVAQGQIVQNGGATGTSLTVSTLNTGTTLQVSGAVSGDGRYVTMNVDPQMSVLDGIDTFTVGGGGVGGVGGIGGASPLTRAFMVRVPFRPAQVGHLVFVDKDKALLGARVPAMSLAQTSLRAASRKLADVTKCNIVLGFRGLEEAGISPDLPRDFVINAGTLKDALLAMLRTAAGETDMVITTEDKVISVATQAQADNAVVSKTYQLTDLLANAPRWMAGGTDLDKLRSKYSPDRAPRDWSKPPGEESEATTSTGGRSVAAGGAGSSPGAHEKKPAPVSTNIVELITSTVRPEIWKVNGGKVGEIGVAGNIVMIRAPQSVHALLEGPARTNPNRVPMYVGYGQ